MSVQYLESTSKNPAHVAQPLSALGLPEELRKYAQLESGLVVISGTVASGKTSTMASILEEINRTHQNEVILSRSQIQEFAMEEKGCQLVHVKEPWGQSFDLADGDFSHQLDRYRPRIIALDELRDLTTITTALKLADSGHLVFATLHAHSTENSIVHLKSLLVEELASYAPILADTLQGVVHTRSTIDYSVPRFGVTCTVLDITEDVRNDIRRS